MKHYFDATYKRSLSYSAHFVLCFIFFNLSFACLMLSSASAVSDNFAVVWKKMSIEQKYQYIAGYLHALRDINRVLSITRQFVRENPDKALDSINKLYTIYAGTTLSPATVVRELNKIYSKDKAKDITLSYAISLINKSREKGER